MMGGTNLSQAEIVNRDSLRMCSMLQFKEIEVSKSLIGWVDEISTKSASTK